MPRSSVRSSSRVHALDELRGLSILLMVVYHAFFDLVYLFHVNLPVFHSKGMQIAQTLIAGTFITLSGIVCRYSRSNGKRGFQIALLGLALTLCTVVFIPEQAVYFGILHFLGTAMLLFAALRPLLDRLSPVLGALLMLFLFAATRAADTGYLGFPNRFAVAVPAFLQSKYFFPLGLGSSEIVSSDFFPLFPWLFLFLAGTYLGVLFRQKAMPAFFYRSHAPWLAATGRNTLWIYLLHQPVLYSLLFLFFQLVGRG